MTKIRKVDRAHPSRNENNHAWIDRPNAEELVFINGRMSDSSDSD